MIGFKLPADYLYFAEGYNGFEGFIGEEYVRLWDIENLIEENSGYAIVQELDNTIGIGGNGGGEFLAIEMLGEGAYRVVLSPFIDLDKKYFVDVGSSFTDFLQRLVEGRTWFEDKH